MNKKILVIPGDGIGAEVTTWGKAVLEKIAGLYGHTFSYDEALMGHAAIEATRSPRPDETLVKAKAREGILLGAAGHPQRFGLVRKLAAHHAF